MSSVPSRPAGLLMVHIDYLFFYAQDGKCEETRKKKEKEATMEEKEVEEWMITFRSCGGQRGKVTRCHGQTLWWRWRASWRSSSCCRRTPSTEQPCLQYLLAPCCVHRQLCPFHWLCRRKGVAKQILDISKETSCMKKRPKIKRKNKLNVRYKPRMTGCLEGLGVTMTSTWGCSFANWIKSFLRYSLKLTRGKMVAVSMVGPNGGSCNALSCSISRRSTSYPEVQVIGSMGLTPRVFRWPNWGAECVFQFDLSTYSPDFPCQVSTSDADAGQENGSWIQNNLSFPIDCVFFAAAGPTSSSRVITHPLWACAFKKFLSGWRMRFPRSVCTAARLILKSWLSLRQWVGQVFTSFLGSFRCARSNGKRGDGTGARMHRRRSWGLGGPFVPTCLNGCVWWWSVLIKLETMLPPKEVNSHTGEEIMIL